MNTIGDMQIPMDQLRPWLKVLTAALWIGVVVQLRGSYRSDWPSDYYWESLTLFWLGFLTILFQSCLRKRPDSWLIAACVAGLIVGFAQSRDTIWFTLFGRDFPWLFGLSLLAPGTTWG